MKKYNSYKPTNTPWLPYVPEHWQIRRAKFIFNVIDDKTAKGDEELLSVSEHHGVIPRKNTVVNMFQAESYEGYKLCRKGDLVVNSLWAWSRGLGFSDYEGIISNAYSVYRLKHKYNYRYFHYLLRANFYVGEYYVRSKGIWISRLQLSDLSFLDIPIIVPPTEEQSAIVNFLDAKVDDINRFINKKQKLIELLKEQKQALINTAVTRGILDNVEKKRCQIKWLQQLPKHWEVVKLKHLASVQSGLALNETVRRENEIEFPYLRVANVQDGFIELQEIKTVKIPESSAERFKLHKYDLLMNEGGDFDKLGRGVVWEAQIDPCLHQNHVFAVRCKKGVDPYWLNLLTLTHYAKSYFISRSKQTTNLASISSTSIKEFPVLMPPPEEIEKIKEFISKETELINSAMGRIEKEIDLITEYKQSLIAEAVTGKIDVRSENKLSNYGIEELPLSIAAEL